MASKFVHTPEQELEFHTRRLKLQNIPKDFVNRVLKLNPSLSTKINRIENVRYGRTIDMDILELLEWVDFKIRLNRIQLIPEDYVKRVLQLDDSLSPEKIQEVREGKMLDFKILTLLEELETEMKERVSK